LYERRRAFNEERKTLLTKELELKNEILIKVSEFETFYSEMIRDWQAKTKELLALQDEWKAIPNHFREKTTDINKQFWGVFKKFMHNKNEFFKQLDKGKKEALTMKQALVDEVNSLKDGEDWDGIANRMKQLQHEWKNLAPVFGKEGQKVYDDFKAGIDHFFVKLRDQRSGEDKVQKDNLTGKDAVCDKIEALASSGNATKENVESLKEEFRNFGFVPMKAIQRINGRFSKAMMEMIEKSTKIAENEKERLKINLLSNRSTYSTEGVKSLKNQEGYIQKRLQQLRKDVGNLEDNVSMFKMSKNAMALIEDVQKRINLLKLEIKELESQLKEIRAGEKVA
jgi:predicted transposase YbfD/YdcC